MKYSKLWPSADEMSVWIKCLGLVGGGGLFLATVIYSCNVEEITESNYQVITDEKWDKDPEVATALNEAMQDRKITRYEFRQIRNLMQTKRVGDYKNKLSGGAR